ncbi:MAG: ATP-binding protein [Oscillospiraceae bacterium]|nr:ATP-binding protein [Oscillospiraceae bacterium]
MKTTPKRIRQAELELERRRSRAQAELRERRELARAKIPALEILEQQIARAGSAVVSAIGRGEDMQEYLELLQRQNLAAQAEREKLLAAQGFPAGYLQTKYVCDLCGDTGFVLGKRCECFAKLLRAQAYQELCMDAPLESSAFESFDLAYYAAQPDADTGISPRRHMEGILNSCKSYAEKFGAGAKSLLFFGPTGLGKTHLSLAIAREVIDKGYIIIYGSAQNLLGKMERERFARFGENTGEVEQALLECDLLILDDLGTEFSTQFTASAIYNIVNTRLNRGLPTIINTNLSPKEMEGKYAGRVTSRIIGNYAALRFFGGDIRQAKLRRQ